MAVLKVAWSDADRTPYLYTLQHAAAAYGLDLDLIRAGYGDFPRILLDGDCEFIAENYYNLQIFRSKGVPLVSVVGAVNELNETLIVRPSIRRLEDLRGEKIAIRGRHRASARGRSGRRSRTRRRPGWGRALPRIGHDTAPRALWRRGRCSHRA